MFVKINTEKAIRPSADGGDKGEVFAYQGEGQVTWDSCNFEGRKMAPYSVKNVMPGDGSDYCGVILFDEVESHQDFHMAIMCYVPIADCVNLAELN